MSEMPKDFRVDPAKIDARLADHEAEACIEERIAWALEEHAEEHHRKAAELRRQNRALIETAKKYGYQEVSS